MFPMRIASLIAATLLLTPAASHAQPACAFAPDILSLAETILAGRTDLPNLQSRRFGAEAAYLILHYGAPDADQITALLASIDGVPAAGDLIAALAVSRDGVPAGLATLDPDPLRAFAMAGPSARRAILLADDGLTYFTLLAQTLANPDLAPLLPPNAPLGTDVLALVTDQPDATLLALSQSAAAAGFLRPAATLAAAMTDRAAFTDLTMAHLTDPVFADDPVGNWHIFNLATLVNDTGILPRPPSPDGTDVSDRAAGDQQLYDVNRAAYHSGPAAYLATFLNQTGLTAETAIVARAYLDEVSAGRIDPVRDPDQAWLFQYRALAAVLGRETAQSVLPGFDFPGKPLRPYATGALSSLDWMLATEALGPVVVGGASIPTRPALLTDDFDWLLWTEIATAMAAGAPPGDDPARMAIAAALYAGTGSIDGGIALADRVADPFERLYLLRDLMQRLDRQCDATMAHPGQALLLGGDYLFKF
jgi:hypothetical protein